jgi:hypothetical protein
MPFEVFPGGLVQGEMRDNFARDLKGGIACKLRHHWMEKFYIEVK